MSAILLLALLGAPEMPEGPVQDAAPAVETYYPDQPRRQTVPAGCEGLIPVLSQLAELLDTVIWATKLIAWSVFGLGLLNVVLTAIAISRAGRIQRRLDGLILSPKRSEP